MKRAFNPKRAAKTLLLAGTMLATPFLGRASGSKEILQVLPKQNGRNPVVVATSDFKTVLAENPDAVAIAQDLNMSVDAFAAIETKVARLESTYDADAINISADSPSSTADGAWQFTDGTLSTVTKLNNLNVTKRDLQHPRTIDALQKQNSAYLAYLSHNIKPAEKFVAELKDKNIEMLVVYNDRDEAFSVSLEDENRVILGLAHAIHKQGPKRFKDVTKEVRYASAEGKQVAYLSLETGVGKQNALTHFKAAFEKDDGIRFSRDVVTYRQSVMQAKQYLRSYLQGDEENSDVDNLADAFILNLARMLAEAPAHVRENVSINSGWRSYQEQAKMWADAVRKYGSEEAADDYVSRPGHSKHNHGSASDLHFASRAARNYMHENAEKYGLCFPMGHEKWHIQLMNDEGPYYATNFASAKKARFYKKSAPIAVSAKYSSLRSLFAGKKAAPAPQVTAQAKKKIRLKTETKGGMPFDGALALVTQPFEHKAAKPVKEESPDTRANKDRESPYKVKRDKHAVLPPEDELQTEASQPHVPEGGDPPPDMLLRPVPQIVNGPPQQIAQNKVTPQIDPEPVFAWDYSASREKEPRPVVDTSFGEKHVGKQLRVDGIDYIVDKKLLAKMAGLYGDNVSDVLDKAMRHQHRNRFTTRSQFDANSVLAQALHNPRNMRGNPSFSAS